MALPFLVCLAKKSTWRPLPKSEKSTATVSFSSTTARVVRREKKTRDIFLFFNRRYAFDFAVFHARSMSRAFARRLRMLRQTRVSSPKEKSFLIFCGQKERIFCK